MNNWAMQSILSRLAATAGFKEVCAPIQMLPLAVTVNVGNPDIVLPVSRDANQRFFAVHRIGLVRQVAQIVPFVVRPVCIFMVNKARRLLSGHQKPSDSVRGVGMPLVINRVVAVFFTKVARLASGWAALRYSSFPKKFARFGAVFNYITDRIGYKSRSHVESPLSVVRGLAAPTASTPTLSQGVLL